ncbi:uncharacterized protein LOC128680742 [Plodia interpunctella]|uniref:uncharacterized protein LOC128676093 n=1 Tax=Plodia interpunctella TaxID=58824 RepID=UPI00236870D9|nr:uncharacterized protein LOC128676093 [Plodia interpunctella]XP_053620085.1 uncharacterized protein LOC128680742 [Plodia interpunctella]
MNKDEERIKKLLEDVSTPESSDDGSFSDTSEKTETDPFEDNDGEYGTDADYVPNSDSDDSEALDVDEAKSEKDPKDSKVQPRYVRASDNNRTDTVPSTSRYRATLFVPPSPSISDQNSPILPLRPTASTHISIESASGSPVIPLGSPITFHKPQDIVEPSGTMSVTTENSFSMGCLSLLESAFPSTSAQSSRAASPVIPLHEISGLASPEDPVDQNLEEQESEGNPDLQLSLNVEAETPEEEWTCTTELIPEFGFDNNTQGLRIDINENATPLDIFRRVFSQELLEYLVARTNAYGDFLSNSNKPHTRNSRNQAFRVVTVNEMEMFLALCVLQGQVKGPSRRSLFSFSDPLYFHPFFTYIMSGRRFEQILRCLSLSEANAKGEKKVSDFMKAICENFRQIYSPGVNLSIDESLILFNFVSWPITFSTIY